MADTPKENEKKYTRFFEALTSIAPDKTFGGITLAEFTSQIGLSNAPRRRLIELDDEKINQETLRGNADINTMKMCEKIKNGVIADPDFGDDSALSVMFVNRNARAV